MDAVAEILRSNSCNTSDSSEITPKHRNASREQGNFPKAVKAGDPKIGSNQRIPRCSNKNWACRFSMTIREHILHPRSPQPPRAPPTPPAPQSSSPAPVGQFRSRGGWAADPRAPRARWPGPRRPIISGHATPYLCTYECVHRIS